MKQIWMMLFTAGILFAGTGCPGKRTVDLKDPKSAKEGAGVVLTVPDFIEVRSVDDDLVEKFYTRLLFSGEREIHLSPGIHSIVLRYNDLWPIDSSDHEKIRSDYVGLSFDTVSGGAYRIRMREVEDRRDAHRLAADFKPWIIEVGTGKTVSR
jgi:uncharacterized protein YccT (UPF0319 family)